MLIKKSTLIKLTVYRTIVRKIIHLKHSKLMMLEKINRTVMRLKCFIKRHKDRQLPRSVVLTSR